MGKFISLLMVKYPNISKYFEVFCFVEGELYANIIIFDVLVITFLNLAFMKKLNLLLAFLLACGCVFAQFNEDFESYDVGSYVGEQIEEFTTWSGTTGSTQDAKIVDTKANSGSKSIYFYSTDSGPQDVILDFGQKYTSGTFNLAFSIFISDDASAFWNFQQERTVGVAWSSTAYYRNNGFLALDAGSINYVTPFATGQWNKVSYTIDLDNNEWVIQVNDECVGVLLAPASVSSLNIFPTTKNADVSEFWMDDISFSHDETITSKNIDIALSNPGSHGAAFVNSMTSLSVDAINTGDSTINEMMIAVSVDGSEIAFQELTGLDLMPGEKTEVIFEDVLPTVLGLNEVLFSLQSVAGLTADDEPCNDRSLTAITGISKIQGKKVLVEELTGTWCAHCPRGDVFMKLMQDKYGDLFVGVAVHGGGDDPMEFPGYPHYLLDFPGADGYPTVLVDRHEGLNPAGMESSIVERLQEPIPATFEIIATFDENTDELVATVKMTAVEDIPNSRRVGFVLTEDHVTGTTSEYDQANIFSGRDVAMGGYENLPNPVPASMMVYDKVARAVLPEANGMELGESLSAGDVIQFTFSIQLDESINKDNLDLIAFIANPLPARTIGNAYSIPYQEAISTTSHVTDQEIDFSFVISPNPVTDLAIVNLELENTSEVRMDIFDTQGKLVNSRKYGELSGNQNFNFKASSLAPGIYLVQFTVDDVISTRKLVITK